MAFDGESWDETVPTDSSVANQIDDFNRDLRLGVRKRLAHEHVWPSSQTASTDGGYHSFITLKAQTSAPSRTYGSVTQPGALWVRDSDKSLIYTDVDGNDHIIIAAGTTTGLSPETAIVLVPPGVVVPYVNSNAPKGWLLCDGAAVSRTTYARLFAVIGTSYGSGDGSTTFNLPDLRGRVPVGLGAGSFLSLGYSAGAETHTLTIDEMPSHTHMLKTVVNATGFGATDALAQGNNTWNDPVYTEPTGGGQPHNNLQPSLCLNYIIKY